MKKFSILEGFKYTNEEIEDFFISFIDNNKADFKIINGFVQNKIFFTDPGSVSKGAYNAKQISVKFPDNRENGFVLQGGRTFNSIDPFLTIFNELKTFYRRSKEENINFYIDTQYGLELKILLIGDKISDSNISDKKIMIDYLKRIADVLIDKKIKISRMYGSPYTGKNHLDIRCKNFEKWNIIHNMMTKLKNNQPINSLPILNEIGDEMTNNGYSISISGGDNQVIVKIVKL